MNFWNFLIKHLPRFWTIYAGLLAALFLFYKISNPIGEVLGAWMGRHYKFENGSAVLDGIGRDVFCFSSIISLALLVFATLFGNGPYQAAKEAKTAVKTSTL